MDVIWINKSLHLSVHFILVKVFKVNAYS